MSVHAEAFVHESAYVDDGVTIGGAFASLLESGDLSAPAVQSPLEEAVLDLITETDSEALEHLMEHLIMRKQNQVDWLRRAIRTP